MNAVPAGSELGQHDEAREGADQPLGPELDGSDRAGTPAGVSVLDYLKTRHQQLAEEAEDEPLTLEIPEWHGAIAVEFEYPEQGATPIIRAGFRMQNQDPAKAVDAALDIVLGACKQIVGKRPEDSDWLPLDPSGAPVKFGDRLAVMLGIEVPQGVKRRSRFIARNLWSPKAFKTGQYKGDIALVTQAGDVSQWLRGIQEKAEEEIEGE